MPNIKSAIKRMKQTVKRRERNIATKRNVKSAVKAFTLKPSASGLSSAQSELDTAVKKGLLKKATASRRKASLVKIAKEAGVKPNAGTKKTAVKETAKKTSAKTATPKTSSVKPKATTTKKPATKAKAPAKKTSAKK